MNHLTQEVQGVKKDLEKTKYELEEMIDGVASDIPDNVATGYDLAEYAEQNELDELRFEVRDLEIKNL